MNITTNYGPGFGRKPNVSEMKLYTKTINEGLQVLDKKVGIILHNSSAPAVKSQNTGIGSLLSETTEKKLVPFLKEHAVTTIQQEPTGLRSATDASPYAPVDMAKNTLMAPLEKLVGLISVGTYAGIVANAPKNDEKTDYKYVRENYPKALNEAWENYKKGDMTEFNEFKTQHNEELEAGALYQVLSKLNKTDKWKKWNVTDKNLFNPQTPAQTKKTQARLEELRKNYSDDIDFYFFQQMLLEKEIQATNNRNKESGITIIGDSPVAYSSVEAWKNQDLFMKDMALGVGPDFFSPNGQRWGFPVLKPETIFNPDGSLGKGGEFLKQRYEKMFSEAPGGVRIDHIIGLIDPFVYSTKEPKMTETNSGRLYSSPNSELLGKYAKQTDEDYEAILTKIIIPAAEKYGLTKEDIICEDLGTITPPVDKAMKDLKLSGIAVTEFDYRGKETAPEKILMLGSHDNSSFIEYTEGLFKEKDINDKQEHFAKKTQYLAEDTAPYGQNFDTYLNDLRTDKKKFMAASFAELFTSPAKRIQVFFTDFFGIPKTYNTPGKRQGCWTLRLPEKFEEIYYKNIKEGLGLNLPESIATAIRHKGEDFASQHKELLDNLDKFTGILKE